MDRPRAFRATGRVRVRRSYPEQELQKLVVRTVEPLLVAPCQMWHTPMGGWRKPVEAAILKGMGAKPGVSDLLFWPVRDWSSHHEVEVLRLAGIELKAPGRLKDVTEPQAEFGDWLRASGGLWEVLDNLDDVLRTLRRWGVIVALVRFRDDPGP